MEGQAEEMESEQGSKKTRVGEERLRDKEKRSRHTANGFVLIIFLVLIRVVFVLKWIRILRWRIWEVVVMCVPACVSDLTVSPECECDDSVVSR